MPRGRGWGRASGNDGASRQGVILGARWCLEVNGERRCLEKKGDGASGHDDASRWAREGWVSGHDGALRPKGTAVPQGGRGLNHGASRQGMWGGHNREIYRMISSDRLSLPCDIDLSWKQHSKNHATYVQQDAHAFFI
ncbi:hypothetical protein KY285_015243 [Solanum tuberosum]|nr:hypothetical protein KY285_015243 [Solanum tuberosum]